MSTVTLTDAQQAAIDAIARDMETSGQPVELVTSTLADNLRDYSPMPRALIEETIAEHPGAVVVHRSPHIDWPMGAEYVVPDEGLILGADGRTVTL